MLRKWLTVHWQSCYSLVADTSKCDERVKNKKRGGLLLLVRISSNLRLTLTLILALVLLVSGAAAPAAAQTSQESDQDAESGEIGQSGRVLNSGDNSNQCVALQPVANTGNAETDVDIIIETPAGHQYTKRFDLKDIADELDLDLEDIGSTIELSPEQRVECNQAVNQSAAAASEENPGHCSWQWDDGWWCLWSTDHSWWYQDAYGAWTDYSTGLWYADQGGWWWMGYDGWWWTDGYYWYPYGWAVAGGYYSAASDVSAGALNGTGSLATLGVLATLGIAGTGLVIRRNRDSGSEG
jgi:hypothetical protein